MDSLCNHIEATLNGKGFTKRDDKKWILPKQFQQPGQVMVINGQRMEQPSQIINVEFVVDVMGVGYIKSPDKEEDLLYIIFSVNQNEDEVKTYSFGFYKDDAQYFDQVLSNIFNI